MAAQKRSGSSSGRRKTTQKRPAGNSGFTPEIQDEIISIALIFIALFAFFCNFGLFGSIGKGISGIMFALFGLIAYAVPLAIAVILFFKVNKTLDDIPAVKVIGIFLLLLMISVLFEIIFVHPDAAAGYDLKAIWAYAKENKKSGGLIGGSFAYLLIKLLDTTGTVLLLAVVIIICLVLITGRSFLKGVSDTARHTRDISSGYQRRIRERNDEYYDIRQQRKSERQRQREEADRLRRERAEQKQIEEQMAEDERTIKKVSGVTTYSFVSEEDMPHNSEDRDDIHEINLVNEDYLEDEIDEEYVDDHAGDSYDDEFIPGYKEELPSHSVFNEEDDPDAPIPVTGIAPTLTSTGATARNDTPSNAAAAPSEDKKPRTRAKKQYRYPSVKLLNEIPAHRSTSKNELSETASKLENVLASFNVKVKVTDISQGPTVTRYEMIPETGVKVSRIVNLADDIKLNLASPDIRIEAPIPGKSAIGIEVPNRESSAVVLRELLESREYKNAESKISFAVGKDLGGKIVIADIAKMPHMLIAGGTGSGKSVCINTLIMSILYKATPDEVKLIMVDPKVVELSVYNGIPHLLIPVVTDPKKASAALQWAVNEMNDRYQRFAEYGVRNLKGYNEAIEGQTDDNNNPIPKMFQLVVIVDELADLMMVAGKEVEESICRLAQLARAAGIHLIIATQRPSVDVITGLIKANMPSRVAFAVSSGVDSRTILDMNGAEKLLGRGDMLFAPQGYPKPARVQGAFVDDAEVSRVVSFLKENHDEGSYDNEIIGKIDSGVKNMGSSSGSMDGGRSDDGDDEYFAEAARLIVESGKCSIGMLQRKFKIGFNRAARIMDALSDAGIVGPEEGTKPRTILMDESELEAYLSR